MVCLFAHKWFNGKCLKCGKMYTSYGPIERLEDRIRMKHDPTDRKKFIDALPQTALLYLAEHAFDYNVIDMVFKRIEDKEAMTEIALKRNNLDICRMAMPLLEKSEDIEQFIQSSDSLISELGRKKLMVSEGSTCEHIWQEEDVICYDCQSNGQGQYNDRYYGHGNPDCSCQRYKVCILCGEQQHY